MWGGGDFGLSEFIYQRLNRLKISLPETTQRSVAHFVEKTIFIFSIAGPIMTVPQVIKIYQEHNVAGLSFLTWSSYLFLAIFWLIYGVFIGNRPIILANSFWILVHSFIIAGMFIYG